MMNSRFYVTLPSNSSTDYYPDNTVAHYTMKLANKIELEGDWEVGLAEISFPSEVENVVRDQCYYNLYIDDTFVRSIVLPPGNHRRMRTLLGAIFREQIKQTNLLAPLVEFSYDDHTYKVHLQIAVKDSSIQFSPDLAYMLGFDESVKYSKNAVSTRVPSRIAGTIRSMYIYCDILEHVAVGDTRAPLLRIVDNPRKTFGNVHQTMNPILYVPLQKKNFDTVEINIVTDTRVPVPYRSGKSFVVLEFRRAIHAFLRL